MPRPIRQDVKDLLLNHADEPHRRSRTIGFLVGAFLGGTLGIAVTLAGVALFGDDAQTAAMAAVLLGVPGGAWAGAEFGAREDAPIAVIRLRRAALPACTRRRLQVANQP